MELAERRYHAVAPANRFVAARVEQRWEESLQHARQLPAAYARFLPEPPPQFRAEEWNQSTAVASAIAA